MAGANSNIQLTDLDFNGIKNNLKTFLQSQDTFKDYNFDGSGLSVLLDVLSYNTQYNAYYLNMVANEMFLDSAVQRSSIVSHAKLLNYTPRSAIAPSATINVIVNGVSDPSLTLPSYTNFLSEAIDGSNYVFTNLDSYTVNTVNSTATFNDVVIYQGTPASYSYTVDSTSNPSYTFEIPDDAVDTNTLKVVIQTSSSNTYYEVYNSADSVLGLDENSKVYFLQESLKGTYEIYFGDGILGKKLADGNIVRISYISTEGTTSYGANSFVSLGSIGGYSNIIIDGVSAASNGADKETIDSIKFSAPKSYSSQNRAVTKDDYIYALQRNKIGVSFDAVNVWGGEENNPPVYGQVFVCLKPSGGYSLTQTQKERLIQDVIRPISVMTVEPKIVDPDYTYLKLTVNVLYNPNKTTYTANQLKNLVIANINSFSNNTLNTFDSTFSMSDLNDAIKNSDPSIISNDVKIQVQKKIYPSLTTQITYRLDYNVGLQKGVFLSGISSSPALSYINTSNPSLTVNGVYIEELPTDTGGIDSITILNPGYNYQTIPTISILGDGMGATAEAVMNVNGSIKQINVTNAGSGYTSAIVKITPAVYDNTGQGGSAVATLQGQYGTLRSYYYTSENVKVIFDTNVGTVDYINGVITLNSFDPKSVDNELGQLTITATPSTSLLSSSYNKIITIDPYDPNAITVNIIAKS